MGKCFTVFHLVHFGTFSPSVNTIFITRVPRIHKSGIPTAILPPCSLLSLPCWALGRDLPHQSAQCAPQELSSMAALEVHRSRYWCRCPSEKPTFSNSTIVILISSNFNIWAFLCWLISRSSCCRLGAKIYQGCHVPNLVMAQLQACLSWTPMMRSSNISRCSALKPFLTHGANRNKICKQNSWGWLGCFLFWQPKLCAYEPPTSYSYSLHSHSAKRLIQSLSCFSSRSCLDWKKIPKAVFAAQKAWDMHGIPANSKNSRSQVNIHLWNSGMIVTCPLPPLLAP